MIDICIAKTKGSLENFIKLTPETQKLMDHPRSHLMLVLKGLIRCVEVLRLEISLKRMDIASDNSPKKSVRKKHEIPEGFIPVSEWHLDEKNKFIARGTISSCISNDPVLRHKSKKIGREWYVVPRDIWDYYSKSPTGMHGQIKKKQKQLAHLWIMEQKN